ncbi:MAG: PGPGW domain-containing protein [Ignavibacteriota bacterium]
MSANRKINLVAGWIFVLLGIAGFILPVLQGFLFLIVGLLFLSKEYVWAHRFLERLKQGVNNSFPKLGQTFDNAEKYLNNELRKIENEKGYFTKRIWVILLLFLGLILGSYGLALLFQWLKHIMF